MSFRRRLLIALSLIVFFTVGAVSSVVMWRTRRAFEAGLDDVVAVLAIEILDMQADAGILGQRLEPFAE